MSITDSEKKYPVCFSDFEKVFPKGRDGLRESPEECLECTFKTDCLKAAMNGADGGTVREEIVDRAYKTGMIGFLERWSKKKYLNRKMK